MYKSIKNKLNNGATLVELVITIAVASILIASLSFFIGYFVSAVNKVNNFNNTTKNANDVAYQIRDYVDKLNDGNLNYNSENSYLLEYENENNVKVNINFGGSGTLKSQIEKLVGKKPRIALSPNTSSMNLNDDNTRIIWTSSDESLMIASNYYEETNLLKFTITYDNGNKTLSVIKQIF